MVDIIFNIKKVCKRKLIFPLIITVIMPAILFLCPFYNIFHPDVIDNISDVDAGHKYVSVHADRLYYTGYNLNNPLAGNMVIITLSMKINAFLPLFL